jgi:WD40 repeat protein/energy-coupling factor transporter ATP-binding protein EcfA2
MSNDQLGDDRSISIGTSVTDSAVVMGDGNTITVTNTKIIQISVDEIKTRPFIGTSPYKGLRSFESEDQDQFFGRAQFLADLVNQQEQTNLVLLLGASGSGKSSVVKAGLIPWLYQKWGTQFVNLTLTPDQDPFESLYGSLPKHFKQAEVQFVRVGEVNTLSRLVATLKPPEAFWFIFIDQFEELFTTSDPEKRDRFINSLVQLCRERSGDRTLKILATMRADFLDRLDPAPANRLAQATKNHRPLITQMHPDELRLAIEQPAAHHGVVFEMGLVETIIKDVQGQAGYLPLLQYTLNRLWETERETASLSQERMLKTGTYTQLGGVRGTLQKHVDDIYEQLKKEGNHLATQRIFLKLVEIGGDAESGTEWKPVRRRASRAEFEDNQEKAVLAQLIDTKLLVSDRSPSTQESTVEIAHEVLLTSWKTLQDWIKENRLGIALRNRLNDDVALWQAKKADSDLWSGAKLEQVLELRGDTAFNQVLGGFSPPANEFIDASLGKRERELRFYRNIATGAIVALVCITGSLFFAASKWKAADRGQINAQLTAADALFDRNPTSLETLRESLKAAIQLQQSFWVKQDPKLQAQAMETLAQAVYAVREHNQLESHTDLVNRVSFSPDGQMIGTASFDKTAKLWSADGQEFQTLEGHTERVTDISFRPAHAVSPGENDPTIATASFDGTVILWNHEGKKLQTLKAHEGPVWSVQFSPDGRMIATAGDDGVAKLWDLNGHLERTLIGHAGGVTMVRFSPNQTILATASLDKTVKLWEFQGKEIHTFSEHSGSVFGVNFSPDGQKLVSASYDKTAILWDISTKKKLSILRGHEEQVNDAIFSPDGQTIATASSDNTVRLWRQDGTLLETLRGHQDRVNSVSFNLDGEVLVSASNDKSVKIWQRNPWRTSFIGHDGLVYSVSISQDGKNIASSGEDRTIKFWNYQGEILSTLSENEGVVSSINFNPNGKILASGSIDDFTVKAWDLKENTHKTLMDLDNSVRGVIFSPDGKTIAFGSRDKTIKLWNYEEDLLKTLPGHNAATSSVAFSQDGEIIASADEDGTVKLWNGQGRPLRTWQGHKEVINSIRISSDSQMIVTASKDGLVKLWDQEGDLLYTLDHGDSVYTVRFSPNDQMIATAGQDSAIKLWTRDGKLITTLAGHTAPVNSLSFTPDSKMIASVSDDSKMFLWNVENLNTSTLIAYGCKWLKENSKIHIDVEINNGCDRITTDKIEF